ncbi:glycosyltransferase [Ornithinimicrobium flavum]|uniref:glycosyltransferase n=1 Tax=Ornithinimicrobium flavum TaxID=1288636 RepID=UPI001EE7B74E|nr:glycosyltransferase [Ornithinimicrobium flavum]
MSTLLHVVPGPERHGVVRHGTALQEHLARDGVEVLRCERLDELDDGALAGRVVAVQVTDRVLAGDADAALAAWRRVTGGVARLTVVLHDLPQRSDGRSRRARSSLYAALAASADEVVVASRHERLLLAAVLRWARPEVAGVVLSRTHVIPLPIEDAPQPDRTRVPDGFPQAQAATDAPHPDRTRVPDGFPQAQAAAEPLTVVTLGFVYPGKGLEEVIDATALAARDPRLAGRRLEVRNLGRASDGHEDLIDALAARAEAAGIRWSTSGWVDDAELPGLLAAASVPVAAHRHLSASGSIATWLTARRRPLVLSSRYADELAERLPGALNLIPVGPSDDVVPALAAAITDALTRSGPVENRQERASGRVEGGGDEGDPTWLDPGVRLGPSWAESAQALREVADRPAVSVVVPYYRGQALLDLILDRLAAQTGVAGGLEVVVADDGSPEPPDVGAGPGVDRPDARGAVASVRVVRQERAGFRAAAARNLGARAAHGRVLCFLDGDTVPEDGYVAALQQVCLASPALALGRRRHAVLTGEGGRAGQVRAWPPAEPLEEPAWLADGYRASDDLRAADDTSYRFIISAVMALSRAVWDVLGGFEEALTGYGGEDWELGWRCWLSGADLRHVPEAVAWHDGFDLAGRAGADPARVAEVKNGETTRLAPLLPHPLVRGEGWTHTQPDVVVVVHAAGWTEGQLTVVVESLLRQGDVGVWVTAGSPALPADTRVHAGQPPALVLARARALVEVTAPTAVVRLPWTPYPGDLTGTLEPGASPLVADRASGVRVTGTRSAGRSRLMAAGGGPAGKAAAGEVEGAGEAAGAAGEWLPADWTEPVPREVMVERWRQRWSR